MKTRVRAHARLATASVRGRPTRHRFVGRPLSHRANPFPKLRIAPVADFRTIVLSARAVSRNLLRIWVRPRTKIPSPRFHGPASSRTPPKRCFGYQPFLRANRFGVCAYQKRLFGTLLLWFIALPLGAEAPISVSSLRILTIPFQLLWAMSIALNQLAFAYTLGQLTHVQLLFAEPFSTSTFEFVI